MAGLEAALSIFPLHSSSSSSSSSSTSSCCSTFLLSPTLPAPSIKFRNSTFTTPLTLKYPLSPLPCLSSNPTRKFRFELFSTVQDVAVEPEQEEKETETETETENENEEANQKRKLYLVNLPWSLSVVDIKNLFGECGTVKDVEIIKQKDGRSRGFAFVTMASGEEAQAVIDKFDSRELSGRIVRVQFAKRFKRPSPPRPPGPPPGETRHKLYVSNLAWKARSSHLRELFSANCNPVSVRVVFDSPSGRSSGYGFVSFATKEEAEAAITDLDGKELLGRPIRLTLSEKNIDKTGDVEEKEDKTEEQSEEA